MANPRQHITLVLFWLLLLSTIEAASQPAIWSGSSLFRANMYTVISTSTTNKVVNSTVTFGTTYSTVPKLFMALFKFTALPCVNIDFDVSSTTLTNTGFSLGYRAGSTSTINLLSIYTMSFENTSSTSFMSVNHDITALLTNSKPFSDSVTAINSVSNSGYRTASAIINFTSATGETLNVSNTIKAILFIQSITMQCNSGKFNVTAQAIVINSSFYSLNAYTSGNTTITSIKFARFIYDQTTLQASKTTFVDSAVVTASSTVWSQLSVTLIWKTTSNFVVGLTGIAYEPTAAIDFYYAEPTMTCTGASTFNSLSFGYWSYRYRTCPAGYPLFSDITNLCYDICDPYFYTTSTQCIPCYYACYTCSNTSSNTNCTSCNSTVDHRQLSGTNCVCAPGYYDNGVAICVVCSYTCATCTNATGCASCSSGNKRTLISGQCPCDANYINNGTALCVACSTAMLGCVTCTSTTVCTVCNTAAGFKLSGSSCVCNVGYFSSGSTCVACSIPGCQACTSATVCTSCNTAFFNLAGSTCLCNSGTYLSGSNCVACTMTGCTNCTGAAVCTTCNAAAKFSLVGSSCVCQTGYYLSGTTCASCAAISGCTACSGSATCTTCDSALHFVSSGSVCACASGYFNSSGTCASCSVMPSCLQCISSTVCTSCNSPFVLSSGSCVCNTGYFASSSTTCTACVTSMTGCIICSSSTNCSQCDVPAHFVTSGTSCACSLGYSLSGSACAACSSLINGCIYCSASNICTACDSNLNFGIVSGRCLCSSTYFLNSTNNCQLCATALVGCDTCVSSTNCTTCRPASQFILLSNNTCGCAPTYAPVGTSCVSCLISCVCIGYKWNTAGSCTSFCSDNITISPTEECDDGNLVAGDGCSPTCTIEDNYTCIVDNLRSHCSYTQRIDLQLLSTVKSPDSNQLTFSIALKPNLPDLSSLDFSQLFTTSLPLGNPSFVYNNGVLQLTYSFNQSLHGQNLSINFNPGFSSFFFAAPASTINFVVNPTNNLPAIVYDNNIYDEFKRMEDVYKGAIYASYGLLLFGMACNKIIGVELFGVLQLAYLSTSDLNSVQPLLSPLMNMSIVNGINLKLTNSTGQLPNRIREIGYNQLLLGNFNIMLGIMLLDIFAASVLLCVGCILPAFRVKSRSIAKHMLKEYLLMMVIFNIFNIAYSAGVELTYLDRSSPYVSASLAATALSLVLPLAIIAVIIFTDKREFGEFSKLYKNKLSSQGYFVFTIIYRMVLGFSMSCYNEIEEATITNVFYAIIFLLFITVSVPYVQGYHNYRAVIIQLSNLIILSVTMYYRSMKSNTDPSVTYQILSPAMLQVVAIFASLGVSAGCLFFELAMKVKSYCRKQQDNQVFHTERSNIRTESNLVRNGGNKIIPEEYIPDDLH